MAVQIDVTPETATKFQAAAAALTLSIQEYLERVAALLYSGRSAEVDQSQDKSPYELGKEFIGKTDSSNHLVVNAGQHQSSRHRFRMP